MEFLQRQTLELQELARLRESFGHVKGYLQNCPLTSPLLSASVSPRKNLRTKKSVVSEGLHRPPPTSPGDLSVDMENALCLS